MSEAPENDGVPIESLEALASPVRPRPPQPFCAELPDAVPGVAHTEDVRLDNRTVLAFKTED